MCPNVVRQRVHAHPLLSHRVAIAHGDGVVLFDGLKVNGHAQRCADFIVTSIPFADVTRVLIDYASETKSLQRLFDFLRL